MQVLHHEPQLAVDSHSSGDNSLDLVFGEGGMEENYTVIATVRMLLTVDWEKWPALVLTYPHFVYKRTPLEFLSEMLNLHICLF